MNKLATLNYDLTDYILDDQAEKIAEVAGQLSKEARGFAVPPIDEEQVRKNSDFALITYHPEQGVFKKFAKYNKEITEINLALLNSNHQQLPDEMVKVAATNLLRAAKDYKIPYDGELTSYIEKDAYIDPVVSLSDVDNYSFIEKTAKKEEINHWALPLKQKYPLQTDDQIKEASIYFHKNNHLFSIDDSLEFAKNVKLAAEQCGVELEYKSIEKYAALSEDEFNPDLPIHIDIRKSYLTAEQDAAYKLYDDFTKVASDLTPRKAVNLLEAIDKEANLVRAWGKGIENPAIAVYGIPLEKQASTYPTLDELQALDNNVLTGIIGNSDIAELKGEEGVQVYQTLPLPVKREIDNLLKN